MFDGSRPADRTKGRRLELLDLHKRYGALAALDGVSLDVAAGEFVTLLGPSGSGKTTLLMAAAGFTEPDSGRVRVDGIDITTAPPERRDFGMVFQGYALFPHLTVAENIAFPLVMRRQGKAVIRTYVDQTLDLVQLGPHRDKFPRQLSGGQQQRTALGRALVFGPGVLLLDEPLSALDKALREELQWEMKALHRRVGVTFLNVTHDQLEALALSDRVVVMRDGRIVQAGPPKLLYTHPRTRFVASFLGSATFVQGIVCGHESGALLFRVNEDIFRFASSNASQAAIGGTITISLRPERIAIAHSLPSGHNAIEGRVVEAIYAGADLKLKVEARGIGVVTVSVSAQTADVSHGDKVVVSWAPDAGVEVAED